MTQSSSPAPVRISVVIPAYNSRAFVGRAIQSALEQTVPPLEVIVVDDGSTDGTGELIAREFGNRVVYHYQENRGVSAARNAGIRLCSGDWIAFLDADTYWRTDKLKLQTALLLTHPEVDVVACGFGFTDMKPVGGIQFPQSINREYMYKTLRLRNLFVVPGALIRRAVFDRVGVFDETLSCGDDRELWARIVPSCEVAFDPRPLLLVTERPSSLSLNPRLLLRDGPIVNRKVMKLLGENSGWGLWRNRLVLRQADARVLFSAAWAYSQRNEQLMAAVTIMRAIACWPFGPWQAYKLAVRLWFNVLVGTRNTPANNGEALTTAQSGAPAPVRISVVIPTYNSRTFVGRAIRSTLEQTVPPLEVIVVDDGSNDGTGELIAREFGNRVVYHYQENRGVSAARNAGIRLCSGEWIAFLDADDFWDRGKLEIQASTIRIHPGLALVSCGNAIYLPDGTIQSYSVLTQPLGGAEIRRELKIRTLFTPGSVLVRRRVFDEVGMFDETLNCGEDREMWARIVANHEAAMLPRALLIREERPVSLSLNSRLLLRDGPIVNRKVMKLLGENSRCGTWRNGLILRQADARILFSAAWAYFLRNQKRMAVVTIMKSLACWPFGPWQSYKLAARLWFSLLRGNPNLGGNPNLPAKK